MLEIFTFTYFQKKIFFHNQAQIIQFFQIFTKDLQHYNKLQSKQSRKTKNNFQYIIFAIKGVNDAYFQGLNKKNNYFQKQTAIITVNSENKDKVYHTMSKKFDFIKVEPVGGQKYFYQEGDLVLGRCRNSISWPGTINSFIGFDEEEVQVFKVNFIGYNGYACLESYLIEPLSKRNIQKLKSKYRKNNQLHRALNLGEKQLKKYEHFCKSNTNLYERFLRMYCCLTNESQVLDPQAILERIAKHRSIKNNANCHEDNVQQFQINSQGKKSLTKEYKRSQLKYNKISEESIEIITVGTNRIVNITNFGISWTRTTSIPQEISVKHHFQHKQQSVSTSSDQRQSNLVKPIEVFCFPANNSPLSILRYSQIKIVSSNLQ